VNAPSKNLLLALLAAGLAYAQQPTVAWENGHWFTGRNFERRTMYTAAGLFIPRPAHIDSVIDLAGGYIVPPFGEAHNHNIEWSERADSVIGGYLRAGVFYVENPDSLPASRQRLGDRINRPGTLDVTFANGGLTGPGGHPAEIADRNIARGLWAPSDGEGAFYFSVANRPGVESAFRTLIASRPDFVKAYLLYSEYYSAGLRDPATAGWRGLDPNLMPLVVLKAHKAGLRVAVHVETAADFHVAAAAGVDQIAHIPGFRGDPQSELPDPQRYRISPADVRLAAQKGIVVVTTLAGLPQYADEKGNATLRRTADALNTANLALLRQSGVSIAIGSDEYSDTSVREAVYLNELRVFDSAELLRIWTQTTPRAIFPGRRIGTLAPGYEASFLSLSGDPLADFSNIKRIRLRVKQGREIPIPP
jgi:hypothetical protein